MACLFKGKWHEHSKLEMKYVKDTKITLTFDFLEETEKQNN